MSEDKHYVYGVWNTLRPDTRQYKQQSIEIGLDTVVAVEVPAKYVFKTFDDPKTGEKREILTPEGMRFVQEQFEKLFAETQSEGGWEDTVSKTVSKAEDDGWDTPTDKPAAKEEDDWKSLVDDKPAAKSSAKEEDDWGNAPVFDDEPESTGNAPDTETWNEDEEDWK